MGGSKTGWKICLVFVNAYLINAWSCRWVCISTSSVKHFYKLMFDLHSYAVHLIKESSVASD